MKIIDIHCHPALKPYNNEGYKGNVSIWEGIKGVKKYFYKINSILRSQIQETARDSQAHLNEFVKGNVESAFLTIHPAERGWFKRNERKERWIKKKLIKLVLPDKKMKYLGASLTGMHIKKIEKILERVKKDEGIDYFHGETWKEYDFIQRNQEDEGPWGFKYKIAKDYDHYKSLLKQEKYIPVILTIEGGHSLMKVDQDSIFKKDYKKLLDEEKTKLAFTVMENIKKIKGQGENNFDPDHTPFFITLSHMYNNFLAGHAKAYGKWVEDLLDQETAMDEGITPLGEKVIEELLSRDNGRRILIDVKHLSMKSRNRYYEIVRQRKEAGDHVPIIASHCAMNGYNKNDENRIDTHDIDKGYFSRWSINLSNEDIQEIYRSEGLIGLLVHEGRMPGPDAKKVLKDCKKKIRKGGKRTYRYERKLHQEYLKIFLSNMFQIVKAVGNEKIWNMICLGSDFDGIMDPFDSFKTSSKFKDLFEDVENFLENPAFDLIIFENEHQVTLPYDRVHNLMFGLSPEEIIRKVSHENVRNFLERYFNDEYLA